MYNSFMINTREQCEAAASIIYHFWLEHPIKARKIGGPIVSGQFHLDPLNTPENEPSHSVYVPCKSRQVPPKCEPLITELLAEAGLEATPIVYYKPAGITIFPG